MDRLELTKGILQLIIKQIDKKGDNYKSEDIWHDLLNAMRFNATTFKKEVNKFIKEQLQNFEDEEIKKDELIEKISDFAFDKYIWTINNRKMLMDFENFDDSNFYYNVKNEVLEIYDIKILSDNNQFIKVLISKATTIKLSNIFEELNENSENVKIKDIIEYLK
ncbi:hypothetical protein [Streptobacillus moniliformis]|uniref:hypothetical protein n=1 Tax=Streptobacillus moniliformis TaxID=34105 RepID=UPI0007E351B9|nr:hypothetical protein [Streptobacillus moniliformis]